MIHPEGVWEPRPPRDDPPGVTPLARVSERGLEEWALKALCEEWPLGAGCQGRWLRGTI